MFLLQEVLHQVPPEEDVSQLVPFQNFEMPLAMMPVQSIPN